MKVVILIFVSVCLMLLILHRNLGMKRGRVKNNFDPASRQEALSNFIRSVTSS